MQSWWNNQAIRRLIFIAAELTMWKANGRRLRGETIQGFCLCRTACRVVQFHQPNNKLAPFVSITRKLGLGYVADGLMISLSMSRSRKSRNLRTKRSSKRTDKAGTTDWFGSTVQANSNKANPNTEAAEKNKRKERIVRMNYVNLKSREDNESWDRASSL